MKKILLFLLILFTISTSAKVATDTINNWQLYKDNLLIFKSNEFEKTLRILEINSNENFKVLKFEMFYDFFGDITSKRIEFTINTKIVKAFTKENEAREFFIIKKEDIKDLINLYKGKTIKLKYYDKIYPKGIVVCQLKFK